MILHLEGDKTTVRLSLQKQSLSPSPRGGGQGEWEKSIKADPAMSLKDIAAEHGTNPLALFEILHEAAQK